MVNQILTSSSYMYILANKTENNVNKGSMYITTNNPIHTVTYAT